MALKTNINHSRRAIGIIILCFAPIILLILSVVYGLTYGRSIRTASIVLLSMGTIIGAQNFYTSFIRPFFYRFRIGSMDDYRRASGFPFIGTMFALLGGVISFGSMPVALLGLTVVLLDTGGPIWFVVSTWRDSSFWDR